jgi:ABC-type uncharacterized transport system ATPase subunit
MPAIAWPSCAAASWWRERPIDGVSRGELAELMVGRSVPQPKATARQAGETVLALDRISARRGQLALRDVALQLRAGEIVGIAGVSGNGQSLLADVVGGVAVPDAGQVRVGAEVLADISPRQMIARGIARIPEDRHAEGLIGDMSITENVVSEGYRGRFSRRGLIDWGNARTFAETVIRDYEVKCPGPEARVRLLSGGNMQKLILGRVMAEDPVVVLANQPTRGLDVGAVAYVHEQLLKARARGAGILLISEDLDELLALSDQMAVIYQGQLSPLMARDKVTIQQLGLMMAGQGFIHVENIDAA